jgi:hypothetical protein
MHPDEQCRDVDGIASHPCHRLVVVRGSNPEHAGINGARFLRASGSAAVGAILSTPADDGSAGSFKAIARAWKKSLENSRRQPKLRFRTGGDALTREL